MSGTKLGTMYWQMEVDRSGFDRGLMEGEAAVQPGRQQPGHRPRGRRDDAGAGRREYHKSHQHDRRQRRRCTPRGQSRHPRSSPGYGVALILEATMSSLFIAQGSGIAGGVSPASKPKPAQPAANGRTVQGVVVNQPKAPDYVAPSEWVPYVAPKDEV